MSLQAQEQALLDLLFDRERRAAFRRDARAALADYGLLDAEIADFETVRVEALELDARARTGFILAQYCRAFPLSFSLVSSLPRGLEMLRDLVDSALLRTSPAARVSAFGLRLRDHLAAGGDVTDARERALLLSVVEAELGMACTAEAARGRALAGEAPPAIGLPSDWLRRPLLLAPLTSAAVLPRPYEDLKRELCSSTGAGLWRVLQREPLTAATRQAVLGRRDFRLLVARAVVSLPVACDPVAEHVTVELGEGFARLLPHIDGRNSVLSLLEQLRGAGAAEALLSGVLASFREMARQGMLRVDA